MKLAIRLLLIILVVAGVGVISYYYGRSSASEDRTSSEAASPSVTTTVPQSAMADPIDDEDDTTKASSTNAQPEVALVIPDNKSFEEVLSDFFGKEIFTTLFKADDLARRFVTSMDNALGDVQPSWKISPLNGPESDFAVSQSGDQTIIDKKNFQRYSAYVEMFSKADAKKMVDIYTHFYKTFQAIYVELGTQKNFNTQVISVINDLLQTPEVKEPLRVFRTNPHGKYLFVNDQFEDLSPAQKILLRMGSENANIVKSKLRQLRHYLIRFGKGMK